MSKFCASCGVALGEGAKFCTGCGAAVFSVPAEAEAVPDDISPQKDAIASKASEKIKEKAKKDGIDFSKRIKAEEDAVETALVGAFDMADKGAALLDDAVGEIVDFIKRIQIV